MMTYATMILGCKVNDFEAHAIKEMMDKDYKEVDFKDKADIYLIFSCCVTNVAESKTRKFIRQARRNNPDAYIVVIGCYAQTKSDDEVFNEVDLIIGSKEKDKVKEYIDEHLKANRVSDLEGVTYENLSLKQYKDKTRAFIKVQDGCNQYCTYCIIPYARGRERSANHLDVIKEAQDLAKTSHEIVLTGIHTGRYFDGDYYLIDLLKDLNEIDGLLNIRLSSIEVTEISDEIIDMIKNNTKLAPHLHIPLQAGSDNILSAMHRPYTIKEFKDRVDYIRNLIPDISISTDLIVGFPNESDEDFEATLNFLKEIKFSFIHVFPYSRKKGTEADKLKGHLNNDIKKARVKAVMKLQKDISKEYLKSFINKKVKVLTETYNGTYTLGHNRHYQMIALVGEYKLNEIYDVEIVELLSNGILVGKVCC